MTEERESNLEPVPDPALRAALVDTFGEQPAGVDWTAIAAQAGAAARFRLRARARVAPWWEQLTPWATRLLPLGAVAAAAALVLAVVTPRTTAPTADSTLVSYTVEAGDPVADAVAAPNGAVDVQPVAGPVDDDWLWNATAAAHAAEAR